MDLTKYCVDWAMHADGIWRASEVSEVSYPSEGHDHCYQVEEDSFWFRHRNQVITQLVSLFPPPGVFFDVGGGNGHVAVQLQNHGVTTVLVEPGRSGVANAQRRGVAHVVQGMWTPERVKNGSAGAVGLFDVVEHIEDDLAFLHGVHETLTRGGRVHATVPSFGFLWSWDDADAGQFRRFRLPQGTWSS